MLVKGATGVVDTRSSVAAGLNLIEIMIRMLYGGFTVNAITHNAEFWGDETDTQSSVVRG